MKEYQYKNLKIINADCMDIMKNYSDNYFDLAIVDPPYGYGKKDTSILNFRQKNIKDWNIAPSNNYFDELFRVSKDQIIWGGNYFSYIWKYGGRCFIYWHKGNPVDNFADGELAWTSFDKNAKQFDYRYYGNLEGNTSTSKKFHPTQKPIQLYNWLLKEYSDKEFKILDTHLGSGSSAIAAFYYGCKEFVGMEIDVDYYNSSIKRIKQQTAQIKLF